MYESTNKFVLSLHHTNSKKGHLSVSRRFLATSKFKSLANSQTSSCVRVVPNLIKITASNKKYNKFLSRKIKCKIKFLFSH